MNGGVFFKKGGDSFCGVLFFPLFEFSPFKVCRVPVLAAPQNSQLPDGNPMHQHGVCTTVGRTHALVLRLGCSGEVR